MSKIPGKQIALNTDPNLGTSNETVSSQYAIKQYVDTKVSESAAVIYTYNIAQATPSPAVINHNLNTFDYIASVYDSVTGEDIIVNLDRVSSNTLEVSYGSLDNDLTVLIFAGDGSYASTSGQAAANNTVNVQTISTNTTVDENAGFLNVDSSGGEITITLPATPKNGQQITVFDFAGNANNDNIIISGNGKLINGFSYVYLNTAFTSIILTFNGTVWSAQLCSAPLEYIP